MTADQFAGIVRALFAAFGGYLVAKGLVDAETVANLAGVAAEVATLAVQRVAGVGISPAEADQAARAALARR